MSRQRRIGSRWRKAMAAGALAVASTIAMFAPSVSIAAGTDTGNGGNADSNGNVTDTKGQQTVSNTPSVGETGKRTDEATVSGNSTLLQTGIEYIGFACAALAGIAVYMFIRSRRIK